MNLCNTNPLTLGTCLKTASVVLLISIVILYVLFQARNIIQGPTISLTDPLPSVQHERRITLNGTAHNVVKLTLNGKEIHTDVHGVFNHTLVLESGYTIMSLNAQDRFGRTTALVKEFVYVPS